MLLSPRTEIRQGQGRLSGNKKERQVVKRPHIAIVCFHKTHLIVQVMQEAFLGNLVEAKHCVNAK